ncbi:MAG: lysophospholipid acyltransferase family protein [Candidatus Kariarchaeaceae archaeon]|jgi:1-acyl-sn-glycerol-3-phosphate acyltransferase
MVKIRSYEWVDYSTIDDLQSGGPADYFNYKYPTNKFWFGLIGYFGKHILQNLFWKVRVEGAENVPRDSNFILMPNHISHADSFFSVINLYPCIPVHAIADEKLFKSPFFKKFARAFNAFPVRKGAKNLNIVRYAAARVNNGDSLLWYPEGQRHKSPHDNSMNSGKLGTGMLAHIVDAPIVPCFLSGLEFVMPVGKGIQIGRRPRSINILVKYGKPVPLDDLRAVPSSPETSQEVVDRIMQSIEALRPRGDYIDQSHKLYRSSK